MKILITGAHGLLGSNLCALYAREHEVIASDRVITDFVNCQNVKLDITHEEDLEIVRRINPDMIVNCAALVNVDYCEEHPNEAFEINCAGTAKLAKASVNTRQGGSYFVHISTDAVFDGNCGNYRERSKPAPINVYGQSKLCAEKAVIEIYRQNRNFAIVRTNLFGWNRQEKDSLAEWMLKKLEKGVEFPAFKDVLFSPILVNDLGEIILDLAGIHFKGIIHIAGNNGCSKLEFARMIAATFGLDENLIQPASVQDAPLKAKRAKNMILDVSKAKKIVKHEIRDIEKGIRRFKDLKESGYLDLLRKKKGN